MPRSAYGAFGAHRSPSGTIWGSGEENAMQMSNPLQRDPRRAEDRVSLAVEILRDHEGRVEATDIHGRHIYPLAKKHRASIDVHDDGRGFDLSHREDTFGMVRVDDDGSATLTMVDESWRADCEHIAEILPYWWDLEVTS